jgi:hypothetical protein
VASNGEPTEEDEGEAGDEDEEDTPKKSAKSTGFTLEFDAARKIAQGLGVHMEDMLYVVEIQGNRARLLPLAERARYLLGKEQDETPKARRRAKAQLSLFDAFEEVQSTDAWGPHGAPKLGRTALDRVHQSMILFAAGRSEALKRFLVEEGAGRDARFWRLAQALSALYPKHCEEKRWVDGVLARKKGMGL